MTTFSFNKLFKFLFFHSKGFFLAWQVFHHSINKEQTNSQWHSIIKLTWTAQPSNSNSIFFISSRPCSVKHTTHTHKHHQLTINPVPPFQTINYSPVSSFSNTFNIWQELGQEQTVLKTQALIPPWGRQLAHGLKCKQGRINLWTWETKAWSRQVAFLALSLEPNKPSCWLTHGSCTLLYKCQLQTKQKVKHDTSA